MKFVYSVFQTLLTLLYACVLSEMLPHQRYPNHGEDGSDDDKGRVVEIEGILAPDSKQTM